MEWCVHYDKMIMNKSGHMPIDMSVEYYGDISLASKVSFAIEYQHIF